MNINEFEARMEDRIMEHAEELEDYASKLAARSADEIAVDDELRYTFPDGKVLQVWPAQVLWCGLDDLKGRFVLHRGHVWKVTMQSGGAVELEKPRREPVDGGIGGTERVMVLSTEVAVLP